jgi:hypothetical protein
VAINNKSDLKHNKEAGLNSFITIDVKPNKRFTLVEPDELLEGHTVNSYKDAITNQLRYFETTFFKRDDSYLNCNTDLTKEDILEMQSRKMRINISALLDCINGKSQSVYKNLDDFKKQLVVKVEGISLIDQDWADVSMEREVNTDGSVSSPDLVIWFNLAEFSLGDYSIRNMINLPCYSSYLTSIEPMISCIKFFRSIIKTTIGEPYNLAFKRFSVDMYNPEYYQMYGDKDIIVTFNFNVDLYFSHLKYLYKVIQTYQ